jgi:hypothetical protein
MAAAASWLRKISADAAAAAALVVASGVGAVVQGQDANIDLYRYHLYVGYAFVHARLDHDLVPSALTTFLNPVLDAFHYLGIVHLPPRVFAFLLGSIQGLNAVVVLLLARSLLQGHGSRLLALLAALLAASGPTARSQLGTTLGDTTVSLPALIALLLVVYGVRCLDPGRRTVLPLSAGLLAGASLGLKLTMAPAVLALGCLVALAAATKRIGFGSAFWCLGGTVLGYLAVAGYWCWQLWRRFGNPIFPFANQVFRSPYVPTQAIRDPRWGANGLMDYLSPPLDMALGWTERLQEIPFRDGRFLALAVTASAWLVLRLARRRSPLPADGMLLLAYFVVGYASWAVAFYYYRYAAVLELLAPLVMVVLLQAALPRLAPRVLVGATILLLLSSSVSSWGRVAFGEQWFHVRLPPQAYEPDSLVLVDSPLSSFLIPYFPGAVRFAGLEWAGSDRFESLLAARIAAHRGRLMWLVSRGQPAESTGPERFGLAATDDCGLIRTGQGRWALCRVTRAAGPRQ